MKTYYADIRRMTPEVPKLTAELRKYGIEAYDTDDGAIIQSVPESILDAVKLICAKHGKMPRFRQFRG